MNVRLFVSFTALLLLGWLAVTWMRHEPYRNYPAMGKGGVPVSARVDSETSQL